MDVEYPKRLIALTREKRELEAKLDAVKKTLRDVERRVIADFIEHGVDSTKIEGSTLSLTTTLRCQTRNADAAAGYLHRIGLGELAPHRANANKMSGYVREIKRSGEELPSDWGDYFEVVEDVRVGVRL